MSRSKSDTNEVISNSPPFTPSFTTPPFTSSHLYISSTQTISATTSSASPVVSSTSIPTTSGSTYIYSQILTQVMANQPWINPGVVLFANPHPLPNHTEKWLPKYNLDDGLLAKEHINNFMLSMNLNGVAHEDIIVRLFPYTLKGSIGSWYFSLLVGTIIDWVAFEQQVSCKIWR